VDLSIGVAKGEALSVGTGKARGVHADGALPAGFSPRSMAAQAEAPALHPTRQWKRDDRLGNRPVFVASADGGAWCAWLLLVRKEVEEGPSPDAKAALEIIEGRLRAGTRIRTHEAPSESSLVKMGSRESILEKQG